MYVEKIDLGEETGPRTIVSGLKNYIKTEDFQGKMVIVAANLKASKFGGVLSQGMVLAASNSDKSIIELLEAPQGSEIGECITFDGLEYKPDQVLNPKHKVFEKCSVDFTTSDELVAQFQGLSFKTKAGEVKVKSLKKATIS